MPVPHAALQDAPPSTFVLPRKKPVGVTPTRKAFAEASQRLDAISDPVRLQILWWIAQGERSVTDLCKLVGMRQQAVTHHLNIAKLRRLVDYRREGRWNLYRLTDAGQQAMAAAMMFIR